MPKVDTSKVVRARSVQPIILDAETPLGSGPAEDVAVAGAVYGRDIDLAAEPWNMPEAIFRAAPPRGFIYRERGHGTEEASNSPEGIVLTHRFWLLPVEARKHVVMHELGHDLSDRMLADGSAWELVDAIFPKSKWPHVNGQTTPGEAWAELYALWREDPAHLEAWPGAEPLLAAKVLEYGLPVE